MRHEAGGKRYDCTQNDKKNLPHFTALPVIFFMYKKQVHFLPVLDLRTSATNEKP